MSRNCVRCETRYYGQILLKLHILTTPQYPVQREILSCCVLSDQIYTQTWNLPLNTHYCRNLLSNFHLIGCLFLILPTSALRLHNTRNLGFIFTESQGNFLVLIIRLIDWLIDWFIDWLNDWLTNWSTDWPIDWLTGIRHGKDQQSHGHHRHERALIPLACAIMCDSYRRE